MFQVFIGLSQVLQKLRRIGKAVIGGSRFSQYAARVKLRHGKL
jgi:hypothetical protein